MFSTEYEESSFGKYILLRYITNLRENAEEGTKLIFEGGLDRVEDLDKVFWIHY